MLQEVPSSASDPLKKRKLVVLRTWKTYHVTRGAKFARERRKPATELTFEMLQKCAASPAPAGEQRCRQLQHAVDVPRQAAQQALGGCLLVEPLMTSCAGPQPDLRQASQAGACRGTWQDQEFKAYNFDALGAPPPAGALHPLLKVRLCPGSCHVCARDASSCGEA